MVITRSSQGRLFWQKGKAMNFNFVDPETGSIDMKQQQPASYIRKSFRLDKPVRQATLYMTALGVYKGYINGEELGHQMLTPGFTNYHERVQYQSYDVTASLRQGENVIAAIVGDGWYRGTLGLQSERNFYGSRLKFACVLKLEDDEGVKEINTDETWKATQNGPIRINDLKTFETVDRRMELLGWNDTGFDDQNWNSCMKTSYKGRVIPQEGEKILEQERFQAKLIQTPNGDHILDFGQNHSGHVEFNVTGKAGNTVMLTMGEALDENGNFTQKNLQPEGVNLMTGKLGQMLTYTLKEGTQTYKSLFLISGYRYVKLTNWPEEIKPENFVSIAIYSELKPTGEFACSNPLINQLVSNVLWSQHSNFVDIPTDCPTRERAGWTGDINVYSETACYLTDTKKFLMKWLHDFISLQDEKGGLPFIVPEFPMPKFPRSSAGWSDAIANIPMTLYRFYGEKAILSEVYNTVKKYVNYEIKRAKKRHILHLHKADKHYEYILDTGFHWGEWLEPGSVMAKDLLKALLFPDSEVATAWFYHTVNQLSQMAEVLGEENDRLKYSEIARKIKEAYKIEFLKNGKVCSKRHCRHVRPVAMGLVEGAEANAIVADLNQLCEKNNYKIGTGFLTTYKILQVLCDYGYVDSAYRILENLKCPGWLYEVNKGATTTWENWLGIDEKNVPKDSHNHYAPGSVVAWLFGYCAGIRPEKPGFSSIQIKPFPSGSLTWAKGVYNSPRGKIVSDWKIDKGVFNLSVEIPDGVACKVIMPDHSVHGVNGGNHEFSCGIKNLLN